MLTPAVRPLASQSVANADSTQVPRKELPYGGWLTLGAANYHTKEQLIAGTLRRKSMSVTLRYVEYSSERLDRPSVVKPKSRSLS